MLSAKWGVRLPIHLGSVVPDTVSLIIWLIAGIAGGFAVGDLFSRNFHLDPARSAVAGALGGVIGSQILQLLIPALGGFGIVPIIGQAIGAFASGAGLTVVADAVIRRRRRR
jgi:hypothetical protein